MKKAAAAPADVDSYLAELPEAARIALEKLRKTIRAAAPDAEETISYQIPTFKLDGPLVGFAAFKDHCSFFVMSYQVMADFKDRLKDYKTATATIRFTVEEPLPAALVKSIVRARIGENEARREKVKKAKTAKRVK